SVTSLAYFPDRNQLISSSEDETVQLWNVTSGECLATLVGHGAPIEAMAVSPDGRTVAVGSDDPPIVRLWDLTTYRSTLVLHMPLEAGVAELAFTPDSRTFVAVGYCGSRNALLCEWSLDSLEHRRTKPTD